MTTSLIGGMEGWVGWILALEVKALALLALAAAATWTMRRRSAAARHWVWLLGIAGLLLLPLLQTLAPAWSVPVPGWAARPGAGSSPEWTVAQGPLRTPVRDVLGSGEQGPSLTAPAPETPPEATASAAPAPGLGGAVAPAGAGVPLGALLAGIWMFGTLLLLAGVGASLLATRRLARACAPLADGRVRRLADLMAGRLGIRRPVRFLVGSEDAMPMSWGWLRPTVLLPAGAERWSDARLAAVLMHELAHVRRADCATQVVAEAARALHWPNPLAWLAARRLRVEREYACDDAVLAAGARASDYADELIALARAFRPTRGLDAAAVALVRPSTLAGRLRSVLDAARSRTFGRGGAVGVGGVAVALVTALAALTPAPPLPAGAGTGDVEGARGVEAAWVVERGQALPQAPAPSPQATECGPGATGWTNVSSHGDDERETHRWSKRGCEIEMDIRGEIGFTDDFTEIARLERGGLVRITQREGSTERRLEITPGEGGRPAFSFEIDGKERPFDAGARAWYEDMLLQAFRAAGFRADERVDAMLRRGGARAVLAELSLLTSDYVFATYAERLIEKAGDLTNEQALDLVRRARERVDSDYYMAEILKAFAGGHMGDDRMVDEFLAAAGQIESDFYKSEVLRLAFDRSELSTPQVGSALQVAGGMESDYYEAEVLTALAGRYALDAGLRRAYLDALPGIESDYYLTEVLKTLLRQRGLGASELAEVLRAARGIESDSYAAEALGLVAEMDLSSDALQDAYVEVVDGMESDAYRAGSLTGLLEKGRLADALVAKVIASARRIESDYYKAEVLSRVARDYRLEGATRQALIDAIQSIESSYYRGEVAQLVPGR